MNKLSLRRVIRDGKRKQFHATELALVRKMVGEIMDQKITYKQAMVRYNVTKYQVEKWLFYIRNELVTRQSEHFDEELKLQIIGLVQSQELSVDAAAAKYKVDASTIKTWVRRQPRLKNFTQQKALQPTDAVKRKVAQQVFSGSLSHAKAARIHKVSPKLIAEWVSAYGMFNLDGSINYQILQSMSADQKEKELLEQIELLKKQLDREKLKSLGLETLIEVAEEKFGIKIKKKPGEKQ